MFGKKKKVLFGSSVEPDCRYCHHNGGQEDKVICTLHAEMKNGKCKKYQYDPLMRKPRKAPSLGGSYSEDDFKL